MSPRRISLCVEPIVQQYSLVAKDPLFDRECSPGVSAIQGGPLASD